MPPTSAVTASSFHVFSCDPLERIFSSCAPDSEMTSGEVLAQLELAVVNHVLITGEEAAALCTDGHMEVVETGPNPQGLCALARQEQDGQNQETLVYALPRPEKGMVQVRQSRGGGGGDLCAHNSNLACLALSPDGRLLATASSMGTLVRVFSTADGVKLQEIPPGSPSGAGSRDPRTERWQEIRAEGGEVDMRAVRVHGDKTIAVHAGRLDVLGHSTKDGGALALLHLVPTGDNPLGLCAVSSTSPSQGSDAAAPFAFTCPRAEVGEVHVERWEGAQRPVVTIRAHSSRLASMAMSYDGRLVATASVTGTLVRIFCAADGALLQELRRGTDRADIHCIAFSPDSKWLAVTSDKATVHVFSVNVDLPSPTPEDGDGPDGLQAGAATTAPPPAVAKANKKSSLSFLGGFLPGYFSSEWSLAQFRVREGTKHLVAFGKQPNTVLIIGMDGSFYRCRFDPEKGGDMEQLEHMNFMNLSQKTLSPPIF